MTGTLTDDAVTGNSPRPVLARLARRRAIPPLLARGGCVAALAGIGLGALGTLIDIRPLEGFGATVAIVGLGVGGAAGVVTERRAGD